MNLKPKVPTKAVCAEHLELRKEILTLLNLQKQVVYCTLLYCFSHLKFEFSFLDLCHSLGNIVAMAYDIFILVEWKKKLNV